MKAIAEKLIPGVSEKTRVAILQQTREDDFDADGGSKPAGGPGRTVFEDVIEAATARQEVEQEIRGGQTGNLGTKKTWLTNVCSAIRGSRHFGPVCASEGGEEGQARAASEEAVHLGQGRQVAKRRKGTAGEEGPCRG